MDLTAGGADVGAVYENTIGTGTIEFGGGTRTLDAASSITVAHAIFNGNALSSTTISGNFSDPGSMNVSSGTVTFNNTGTLSVASLTQSGGELNGTGTLTATGTSSFSGGTQSGSGKTIAQGGATFSATGFALDGGRTLQLGGTSTTSGASVTIDLNGANPNTGLSDSGSGILTILSGAAFTDATTSGLSIIASNRGGADNGGAAAVVNNEGTFTKSGTATTSTISTTFNNTDAVDVQSGTLDLTAGGADVGAVYENTIGTGTIEFGGGTRTLDAASSITVAHAIFNGNALSSTTISGNFSDPGSMNVSSGTVTFNNTGTLSVASLTQSGGELNGTGTLTATGTSSFSGGTQSGSGKTIAQGGATFSATGFALDGGRTLQLGGTSTTSGASVTIDLNGANPNTGLSDSGSGILTILSGAAFTDATTSGLSIIASNRGGADNGGAAAVVNNEGTFTKSGTATTSTISATFNNTGTVDVQSGALDLTAGGADVGAVYENTIGTGTIEFGGGTRTLDAASSITVAHAIFNGNALSSTTISGNFSDPGSMNVSSGTVTFNNTGTLSVASLTQSGGELNGTGTLTATGTSSFSGGTQSGSGKTIAQGGATFSATGFALDGGRTLQLGGTSTTSGASVTIDLNGANPNTGLSDSGSGILTILSGAAFTDATTSGLSIIASNRGGADNGGAAAVVNNEGTFTKSGTATTSTISTTFNNTGTVDVQSGALDLTAGGADVGAVYENTIGTGTIEFGGGTRTLDAASSITVAHAIFNGNALSSTTISGNFSDPGSMNVSSGTVTFNNTGTLSVASLTQSGGELNGTGTLTATGTSSFSGGTQSGSGKTIAQGGATFSATGFALDGGRTLQLGGTSTTSGASVTIDLNGANPNTGLSDSGSGILTILSGAAFTDATTSGLSIIASNRGGADNGGAAAVVNNEGTFTKSGTATTSTISTTFNNTDAVDVQSGTLDLTAGGADVGAVYENTIGTGTIEFGGGTRTFSGKSVIETSALINNGTIVVSSGSLDIASTTGSGSVTITGSGSVTISGGATLGLGGSDPQTITLSGIGATLDLTKVPSALVTSAVISGSTLTVTESNSTQLTYAIAGALPGNDFTIGGDGKGGTDLTLEPIGYLWTTTGNLINAPGQHLYIPHSSGNGNADAAIILVGSTPSASYNPAGPDNVTENVALGDPFFLPYDAGFQPIDSGPLVNIPAHAKIIFPNLTATTTEGIAVYETDVLPLGNPPTPVLNLATITYPQGDNGTPNIQTLPTTLQPGAGTIETLDVASTGSPMTSYAVAWDLYNATAQTFNIYLATFNPSNGSDIAGGYELIFNQTGVTNPNSEAWELKNAGALKTDNQAVSYGLVMPQINAGIEDVIFKAYMASGASAPGVSFMIAPKLSNFATGATNQLINPGLPAQSVLQYTPNAVAGSGFSVAWSEQVNDSNGTHYQVEYAIFKPNFENATGGSVSGSLVSQSVFQVADAQNVRVGDYTAPDGTSHEFVAYGDATSTTVVEFDQSGNKIASITDPSPTGQVFTGLDVSSDGVISLAYASGGSQDTIDVYDFRNTGLNNPSLLTTESNYIRGTEFPDLVTGATGVDNFYYYVGENTVSQSNHIGPSDTFNGGSGAVWSEAIFGDARSDYAIAPLGSGFTVTYTNAADLHSGGLTVDANVQALAFNLSEDPSQTTVNGNTALIVTSGETLTLLHPSTFNTFDISGLSASNVLELEGFSSKSGDIFQTSTTLNGSNTTLMVTDMTQVTPSEFVTLVGNYIGSTWTVTSDGSGGAYIVDPPAASTASIAAGASFDINAPSSEVVTFTGGTGSFVLNDPAGFTGQIVGFTGTAPDAAHSDIIDLVGINYNSAQFVESYNFATGLLTITDGSHGASITFDTFNATLDFASDGNGGTLITAAPVASSAGDTSVLSSATSDGVEGIITFADADTSNTQTTNVTPDGSNYIGTFTADLVSEANGSASVEFGFTFGNDQINLTPGQTLKQSYDVSVTDPKDLAATMNQTVSVSIGGPGNDNFVFAPGIGADTIVNFKPQQDLIELDHFANAQTVQELQSLVTTDLHGDAVINLGHNDSITFAGTTAPQLQQAIVAGHVLLH